MPSFTAFGNTVFDSSNLDENQVEQLLPNSPECLTLITSRRHLAKLRPATHLTVDVFTSEEARDFLRQAGPGTAVGDDPDALARVAQRCGYLPLALGLVAGHMRTTPGWTVTDHADRLDERHRSHRLDTGVQLSPSTCPTGTCRPTGNACCG